jgi:hypothetical protein
VTLTLEVSRASSIFLVQVSTTEVSGSELMNRAVDVLVVVFLTVVVVVVAAVVGNTLKRTGAVYVNVDRVAARAAVLKALAPNEDIIPRIVRREKERRIWYRVDEKSFIETSTEE